MVLMVDDYYDDGDQDDVDYDDNDNDLRCFLPQFWDTEINKERVTCSSLVVV